MDSEKLKKSKPGSTQEVSDNPVTTSGLYRHPNGTEMITMSDPLFGNAQSEAAVRLGFEFVREANADEIKSIIEVKQEQVDPAAQAREDKARLDALELAELRRFKAAAEEKINADVAMTAEAKKGK